MRPTCPCKGCQDRHEACHGQCDRYQVWKAEIDAQRAARDAQKPELPAITNRAWKVVLEKMRGRR